MSEVVSIHAAKTNLSKLVARAEAGEEIIIARGRRPVAKLTAVAPKGKRVFGALRGKIAIGPEFFEPLPPEELDPWEQAPDSDKG
jgi:prevent-host-death family protein